MIEEVRQTKDWIVLRVADTSLTVLWWTLGPGTAIWAALLTWWLTRRRARRQAAGKPDAVCSAARSASGCRPDPAAPAAADDL